MQSSHPTGEVPLEVVEAFTSAAIMAFRELAQTVVVPREPYPTRTGVPFGEVFAFLTLRRQAPGRLILAIPRLELVELAKRYLPAGSTMLPELFDDSAGDFANVIAGQAKTMLKGTPYYFSLSTPVVRKSTLPAESGVPSVILPFDFDAGSLQLQIDIPHVIETR